MKPALINVKCFYNGEVTYNENLPFFSEPVDEDIVFFIRLIRPSTKIDYILTEYIRDLKPGEQ